jgi:hypothetical protein
LWILIIVPSHGVPEAEISLQIAPGRRPDNPKTAFTKAEERGRSALVRMILSDAQGERIGPILPGKPGDPGDRKFLPRRTLFPVTSWNARESVEFLPPAD